MRYKTCAGLAGNYGALNSQRCFVYLWQLLQHSKGTEKEKTWHFHALSSHRINQL